MNITGESFDYGPYRFLPTQRSRLHRRLFRPDRALRLRPPAGGGVLEPGAAGRVPAAAGRRRTELEAALERLRPAVPRALAASDAAPAGPAAAGEPSDDAALVDGACSRFLEGAEAPLGAVLLRLVLRAGERRARGRGARGGRSTRPPAFAPVRRRWPASQPAPGAAPRPPLFRRGRALHDADRRDRGDLGRDRRRATTGRSSQAKLAAIDEMSRAYGASSSPPA